MMPTAPPDDEAITGTALNMIEDDNHRQLGRRIVIMAAQSYPFIRLVVLAVDIAPHV
jgi:hypothetical protein